MSSITLVQLNDVHGYLEPHPEVFWDARGFAYREAGGYARIATLLAEIRRERDGHMLVLDGGDAFHGTHPVVDSKGSILPPILNDLGIDAMTAHWEFKYGPEVLRERVAELRCPLLAASVFEKHSDERPYPATMVREVGDLRIGAMANARIRISTGQVPQGGEVRGQIHQRPPEPPHPAPGTGLSSICLAEGTTSDSALLLRPLRIVSLHNRG